MQPHIHWHLVWSSLSLHSSQHITVLAGAVDCRVGQFSFTHYSDAIMSAIQITALTIVYSTVYSGADQRKHQSSASLAFVRGIHRWPVNSLHRGPVTRKMFPFYDIFIFKALEVRECQLGMATCEYDAGGRILLPRVCHTQRNGNDNSIWQCCH